MRDRRFLLEPGVDYELQAYQPDELFLSLLVFRALVFGEQLLDASMILLERGDRARGGRRPGG